MNDQTNTLSTQIQYKMIEKLSAINQKLKEEILGRKNAQEKLEKALHVKSEFLSTMSHEIRTPLNIITGYAQLMSKSCTNEKETKYAQNINFAANSLLSIVDQILHYSKLESNKIKLNNEEFNVQELGDQFTSLFAEKAREQSLGFEATIDPNLPEHLLGDVRKAHQIIYNIVGNAFKYTETGKVNFRIELDRKNENIYWVRFIVQDTGIGMAKDEINTIFERFRQVQSTINREYGGVGLGLAISKDLVELIGGDLNVESQKNVGSIFTFTLPFQPARLDHLPLKKNLNLNLNSKNALKNICVLLVEDDIFNREMALTVLNDLGCFVKTAKNGNEAITLAEEEEFDLILMDIHMPVLNGYDAAKQIIEKDISTPILGFTADILFETRKNVLAAGMKGLIPKPFSIDELITAIKGVLPSDWTPMQQRSA